MSADALNLTDAMRATRDRYSDEGRLLRYARGRLRHFWPRAMMYVAGSVVLWFLVGANWAVLTMFLAFGGEALDCGFCARAERWLSDGWSLDAILKISVVTATFQALANASCILIAWFFIHNQSAMFFCLVYLSSASINAGVLLPFNRPATIGRLIVYAATLVIIVTTEFWLYVTFTRYNSLDILGVLMMVFMIISFVRFVGTTQQKHRAAGEKLLAAGQKLTELNTALEDQHIELRNLALVAKHANDSVVMTDPDGRITWVNSAFTRMTEYTASEAIGTSPGELLNGPETNGETVARINATLKRGEKCRVEILNYSKSGKKVWVETNLVPILDDEGRIETVIAVERDISLQKKQAVDLADARDAAEKAAHEKADFLATMSHEIRTPMNAIMGMSDLLSEKDLDEDGRLYTNTIHTSAAALLKIINNVLDMSKLEAGKLEMSHVTFDLRDCLQSATTMFRPMTREKGLELVLDLPDDLPQMVEGDDGRLRQIIINILGNAIKFTAEGTVKVAVTHLVENGQCQLKIEVHDQGVGIASEDIDRIFDEFAQAKEDTSRHFGGTGLGLSISRKLAKEMGGDISASSIPGLGSVFTITVGLAIARAPKTSSGENVADLKQEIPPGLRVLVADDNPTNRLLIKKYLADCDLDLEFAFDGRQAVDLARSNPPDVIFMDMNMPEMNGIEATKMLRADGNSTTCIIALTANTTPEDQAASLAAGMNSFLSKPIRKAALLATLVEIGQTATHDISALKQAKS